jgi:peptidoglycan/LPS O-acetylase OafA/YrhL
MVEHAATFSDLVFCKRKMVNTVHAHFDGLRTRSHLYFVFYLVEQFALTYIPNSNHVDQWSKNSFFGQVLFNGGLCSVDTMFIISGFFAALDVIRRMKQKQPLFLEFIFTRIMRLGPASWLILAVLLVLNPFNRVYAIFDFAFMTNLLPLRSHFAGHTWWISCDLQYYICTPGIVPALMKASTTSRRAAFVLIFILAIAIRWWSVSRAHVDQLFYQSVHYDLLDPKSMGNAISEIEILANSSYFGPHLRFFPFICGIFLAIETKATVWHDNSKTFISLIFTTAILLLGNFYALFQVEHLRKLLITLWSPLFSLLAYIVLRNVRPDQKIASFLSWKLFSKISKLIYGSYLTHFVLIFIQCIILRQLDVNLPESSVPRYLLAFR